MKIKVSLIVFVLLVFACKESRVQSKIQENPKEQKKYADPKDEFIQFDTLAVENLLFLDSIASWQGYFRVKNSLKLIKNNTPNEVLSISDELVEHVSNMRDSVTVAAMDEKGMRSRMNALYNQSLRLQEMKTIPSITIPEIKKQTQGLFVIFRMIDRKINAIYRKQEFEQELLEDNFTFSRLDSIK